MYGGLFGDLPAAKKRSSGERDESEARQSDATAKPKKNEENGPTVDGAACNTASVGLLPPQDAWKKAKMSEGVGSVSMQPPSSNLQQHTNHHSILQTVGQAGTSMAFVPTALKRKKVSRFSKALEVPKPVAPATAVSDHTTGVTDSNIDNTRTTPSDTARSEPQNFDESDKMVQPKQPPSYQTHEMELTTTIVRGAAKQSQTAAIHIHDAKTAGPTFENEFSMNNKEAYSGHPTFHPKEHSSADESTKEITDPYDPYVPNDLLQYWERQSLSQERAQLERETREALEKQRILREQLERERRELQEKGDFQQLSEHQSAGLAGRNDNSLSHNNAMAGRGRGRGRGVSNLPAWLVEKQRKEVANDGFGQSAEEKTLN